MPPLPQPSQNPNQNPTPQISNQPSTAPNLEVSKEVNLAIRKILNSHDQPEMEFEGLRPYSVEAGDTFGDIRRIIQRVGDLKEENDDQEKKDDKEKIKEIPPEIEYLVAQHKPTPNAPITIIVSINEEADIPKSQVVIDQLFRQFHKTKSQITVIIETNNKPIEYLTNTHRRRIQKPQLLHKKINEVLAQPFTQISSQSEKKLPAQEFRRQKHQIIEITNLHQRTPTSTPKPQPTRSQAQPSTLLNQLKKSHSKLTLNTSIDTTPQTPNTPNIKIEYLPIETINEKGIITKKVLKKTDIIEFLIKKGHLHSGSIPGQRPSKNIINVFKLNQSPLIPEKITDKQLQQCLNSLPQHTLLSIVNELETTPSDLIKKWENNYYGLILPTFKAALKSMFETKTSRPQQIYYEFIDVISSNEIPVPIKEKLLLDLGIDSFPNLENNNTQDLDKHKNKAESYSISFHHHHETIDKPRHNNFAYTFKRLSEEPLKIRLKKINQYLSEMEDIANQLITASSKAEQDLVPPAWQRYILPIFEIIIEKQPQEIPKLIEFYQNLPHPSPILIDDHIISLYKLLNHPETPTSFYELISNPPNNAKKLTDQIIIHCSPEAQEKYYKHFNKENPKSLTPKNQKDYLFLLTELSKASPEQTTQWANQFKSKEEITTAFNQLSASTPTDPTRVGSPEMKTLIKLCEVFADLVIQNYFTQQPEQFQPWFEAIFEIIDTQLKQAPTQDIMEVQHTDIILLTRAFKYARDHEQAHKIILKKLQTPSVLTKAFFNSIQGLRTMRLMLQKCLHEEPIKLEISTETKELRFIHRLKEQTEICKKSLQSKSLTEIPYSLIQLQDQTTFAEGHEHLIRFIPPAHQDVAFDVHKSFSDHIRTIYSNSANQANIKALNSQFEKNKSIILKISNLVKKLPKTKPNSPEHLALEKEFFELKLMYLEEVENTDYSKLTPHFRLEEAPYEHYTCLEATALKNWLTPEEKAKVAAANAKYESEQQSPFTRHNSNNPSSPSYDSIFATNITSQFGVPEKQKHPRIIAQLDQPTRKDLLLSTKIFSHISHHNYTQAPVELNEDLGETPQVEQRLNFTFIAPQNKSFNLPRPLYSKLSQLKIEVRNRQTGEVVTNIPSAWISINGTANNYTITNNTPPEFTLTKISYQIDSYQPPTANSKTTIGELKKRYQESTDSNNYNQITNIDPIDLNLLPPSLLNLINNFKDKTPVVKVIQKLKTFIKKYYQYEGKAHSRPEFQKLKDANYNPDINLHNEELKAIHANPPKGKLGIGVCQNINRLYAIALKAAGIACLPGSGINFNKGQVDATTNDLHLNLITIIPDTENQLRPIEYDSTPNSENPNSYQPIQLPTFTIATEAILTEDSNTPEVVEVMTYQSPGALKYLSQSISNLFKEKPPITQIEEIEHQLYQHQMQKRHPFVARITSLASKLLPGVKTRQPSIHLAAPSPKNIQEKKLKEKHPNLQTINPIGTDQLTDELNNTPANSKEIFTDKTETKDPLDKIPEAANEQSAFREVTKQICVLYTYLFFSGKINENEDPTSQINNALENLFSTENIPLPNPKKFTTKETLEIRKKFHTLPLESQQSIANLAITLANHQNIFKSTDLFCQE